MRRLPRWRCSHSWAWGYTHIDFRGCSSCKVQPLACRSTAQDPCAFTIFEFIAQGFLHNCSGASRPHHQHHNPHPHHTHHPHHHHCHHHHHHHTLRSICFRVRGEQEAAEGGLTRSATCATCASQCDHIQESFLSYHRHTRTTAHVGIADVSCTRSPHPWSPT